MIITIDGPTASGKSTVGRMLAKKLGYYYVYSGLLFRAVAYILHNEYGYTKEQFEHPNSDDINAVIDPSRFVYRYNDQEKEQIFFDGRDITPFLKEKSIDQFASLISRNMLVRKKLAQWQRGVAKSVDVVVDGRDSGSVVFPNAEYKFYITASEQERAQRWRRQQVRYGNDIPLEQALSYIKERDQRDMERAHSPLIVPDGAHVIDNTSLTPEQTLDAMLLVIN